MRKHATAIAIACASVASGCGAEWYRRSADDEVREIVKHGEKTVLGEAPEFRLEQTPLAVDEVGVPGVREDLKNTPAPDPVRGAGVEERLEGQAGAQPVPNPPPKPESSILASKAPKVPSRVLDLPSALRLAFANNREYQSQKEAVYISALSLTLAQHQFAPRFFGMLLGDWNHAADGSESGSLSPSFGWSMLFANGARLSIQVAQSFFQFFTGDRREIAQTIVSGTLTQPLLRGFGTEIVREPLTQAERDVVYQIRAFERFRRTFAVRVTSDFYRVLGERDRVTNAYLNWQSLVSNHDYVNSLAGAGRLPQLQVDQARQDELQAEDEWNSSVEQFESALDDFKIVLGIATVEDITLDQTELDKLSREPVESPGVTVDLAIASAFSMRLDLKTEKDQITDRERQIHVATDALRAQLDVSVAAQIQSNGSTAQTPLKFNANNFAYGAGFSLDLPLDRKAERNAYVEALIALEAQKRTFSLFEDQIRLAVRDAFRRLERETVAYRIQKTSLALAEARVASTLLLLQASRAITRDVLESQTALNSARNALTSALVNYVIARLEFLRDTEALRVSERGLITALPLGVRPDAGA